jgi:hypothetical protein
VLDGDGGVVGRAGGEAVVVSLAGDACGSRTGGGAAVRHGHGCGWGLLGWRQWGGGSVGRRRWRGG